MNVFKILAAIVVIGVSACTIASEGLTEAQEAVAKAGPKKLKLLIAGFGTIESMTHVDKWLGEQLQSNANLENMPTLSQGEKIKAVEVDVQVVRGNFNTHKLEYVHDRDVIKDENTRNRMTLAALRTKVLTEDSTRYVPMAKDYLQAAISRKAGNLIQVVDRSNSDMALVEQELGGTHSSVLDGATCILTATLGDREEDSSIVTINGKGTQVKTTTFTQPYTFKVRDLQGNVLVAESGVASWQSTVNSVVKSTISDPARKLVERVTFEIANKLIRFFTVQLEFKVKVPKGMDADDATVKVDGKNVDIDEGVRVLTIEHAVVATLDGCKPIRKVVEVDDTDGTKTVKLVFRKLDKGE